MGMHLHVYVHGYVYANYICIFMYLILYLMGMDQIGSNYEPIVIYNSLKLVVHQLW